MIRRIFGQPLGQRQHLTVLVGVLLATLVLTGVLAWQGHSSDQVRKQTTRTHLQDYAASLVSEWAERLEYGVNQELVGVVHVTGTRLPDHAPAALDLIAAAIAQRPLCGSCATTSDVPMFAIDASGAVTTRGPPAPAGAAEAAWARVAAGAFAFAHDSIGVTLLFQEQAGRVVAVAGIVLLDRSDAPTRLLAFVLPENTARAIVRHAYPETRRFTVIGGDLDQSELFEPGAAVGRARLFGGTAPANATLRVGDESDPIWDIDLQVAVVPAAPALVAHAAGQRLPLLIGLMVLIALLTAAALLLVRREADLVRLRADFISSVSHELRTPLAQIRMFTETLLLGRVRSDGERRRSLEIIDQEARRLSELVENVLLFAKSEGGRRLRVTPEPTPFAAEVRTAVESFLPMCRAQNADVRLELQEDIEAPVDRSALRQIMVNLIDNALKYGPSGQRITVGVALFGSSARVWVDDEGPGIPRADRERVFESFVRLRRESDEHVGGSGIGLSVVLGLARLHGGSAWAEEAPGGGTRIVVQFPDASVIPQPGVAAAS